MNEVALTPIPPVKDRSVGLILFGVLTIGLGLVCSLFIPLMLFSVSMAAKSGQPMNSTQQILPVVTLYGVLAVALVWLGVGSILKRRWARALLLIGSWSWLGVGVIALVSMAFLARPLLDSFQRSMPSEASSGYSFFMLIPAAMLLFIFLILPGTWLFFYRSPHVKATCEYLDPVVRWTDRCPLPVLAVVLWLIFSITTSVSMIFVGPAVLPVFGMFVIGVPAKLILAVMVGIWIYAIRGFYRLDGKAWWIVVVMMAIFFVSSAITYARVDILEIYPALGYSPQQIAEIAKFNFMKGPMMVGFTLLWSVPLFGYLIYLRRFFFAGKSINDLRQ